MAVQGDPAAANGLLAGEHARHHVVAYDFGVKRNILRMLASRGCKVTVVPAKTPAAEVLALARDAGATRVDAVHPGRAVTVPPSPDSDPWAVADTLLGRFDTDHRLTLDEIRIAEHELRIVDKIALDNAIEQLPTGYKNVFVLHDVEGRIAIFVARTCLEQIEEAIEADRGAPVGRKVKIGSHIQILLEAIWA